MIREFFVLVAALFSLGVAGGLEKGMISIGHALISWAFAAMVIAIMVLLGRRERNDRS